MAEVVLLRHGKTAGNLRGAYTGSTDESLCAQGLEQMERLKPYPAVDRVYTSPLRRCLETAAFLYEGMEPRVVEDLRERSFGDLEGLTHAQITAMPGYGDWGMTAERMPFPGGEGMEAFRERACAAFLGIAEGLEEGTRTAVITHGGVIMAVLEGFCLPRRDPYTWQCANGHGYLLEWDPAAGSLVLARRIGG